MDDRVKDLVAVQSFNLGKIGTSGLIALRVNFFCGEGGSEAGPDHVVFKLARDTALELARALIALAEDGSAGA
jgi:hypothetical protein